MEQRGAGGSTIPRFRQTVSFCFTRRLSSARVLCIVWGCGRCLEISIRCDAAPCSATFWPLRSAFGCLSLLAAIVPMSMRLEAQDVQAAPTDLYHVRLPFIRAAFHACGNLLSPTVECAVSVVLHLELPERSHVAAAFRMCSGVCHFQALRPSRRLTPHSPCSTERWFVCQRFCHLLPVVVCGQPHACEQWNNPSTGVRHCDVPGGLCTLPHLPPCDLSGTSCLNGCVPFSNHLVGLVHVTRI